MRNKKQKLLFIIAFMLFVLCCAGCGQKTEQDAGREIVDTTPMPSSKPTATPEPTEPPIQETAMYQELKEYLSGTGLDEDGFLCYYLSNYDTIDDAWIERAINTYDPDFVPPLPSPEALTHEQEILSLLRYPSDVKFFQMDFEYRGFDTSNAWNEFYAYYGCQADEGKMGIPVQDERVGRYASAVDGNTYFIHDYTHLMRNNETYLYNALCMAYLDYLNPDVHSDERKELETKYWVLDGFFDIADDVYFAFSCVTSLYEVYGGEDNLFDAAIEYYFSQQ